MCGRHQLLVLGDGDGDDGCECCGDMEAAHTSCDEGRRRHSSSSLMKAPLSNIIYGVEMLPLMPERLDSTV